ncbi:MAG: insulinase family protein [Candidatus Riflebacteria bacterium]|nr:insulinase family protein [Candidatus Riflebacteria bacterium]
MKSVVKLLAVFMLLTVQMAFAASSESAGQVFTLDNGLKVFVKPVHSAPVVALNVWIKVGSVNEEPGEEGYSHLIEHMMFKGTSTYPYGALDNEIKKIGAHQNAFTANDYTCFYLVGASQFFDKMMQLQADAVLNSSFDADELKKETQVVIEELRMSLDNPGNRIVQLIMEESFQLHPYRHPIVGYLQNLEEVTRDKLYAYYKKFYVPANMWVVIVGDVKVDQAIDSVRRYMGDVPRQPVPAQQIPEEPIQEKMRSRIEYADLQHAYVRMGWKVPGIASSDRFALYVIARLIGGGMSSWLWQELVEQKQLAVSAGAGYYSSQFPMLFQVGGVTSQSKVRPFIEAARKIVYRLHQGEIDDAELEKARQQIIAEDIYDREKAEDQATNYGHFAMLSDVEDADRFVENIRLVTSEDIATVARKYFVDSNLTVARLEPEPPAPDAVPEMITLDNGMRLILKQNNVSPLVAVSFKIAAGGMAEDKREAGLANLVAEMLQRGAAGMTSEEIAARFESMGSRFSVTASKSYVSFDLQCLAENFMPSLELMLSILERPEFPESELTKLKKQVEDWIKADEDDLYKYTVQGALEALYPDTPIAYSSYGKIDDVKRFRTQDLKEFHKKHYVGSNMVVAIVGDFYTRELKEALLQSLGRFSQGKANEFKPYKLKDITEPVEVTLKKNREQAQIIYAARTFAANDEKVAPMAIATTILSGSMSSRLFKNLRAKDSLAYSTWAFNVGMANGGYFLASISTAAAKVATATQRLKQEIDVFRDEGFTDEEFEDAKKYLIGQYALTLVDNASMANNYASDELFGKGFDFYRKYTEQINAVSKEQVSEVARSYLLASGSYSLAITQP